ncbi:MAG: hypothetical protein QNJ20_03190 [Paracoccaceae bacterium]|nr:hypothetical protein [Paracoccaceae bacterium]
MEHVELDVSELPRMDMTDAPTGCCPRFDPEGWDGLRLHFEDKLFVRATTRGIMHVPLNMGAVFTRVQSRIEDAGAQDPHRYLVLSRDLSATEAEHYFAVTKDVPEEELVTMSGDFLTRVFEGSYGHAKEWVHEMEVAATAAGKSGKRVFMFYTTCPKCAREYGKNYVVGFVEV